MADQSNNPARCDSSEGQSCGTKGAACPSCGGVKLLLLMAAGLVVAYFVSNRPTLAPAAPSAVKWVNYDQALAKAAENNQPVLLAFKATWCGPCRQMDNQVFAKDAAAKALTGWVPVHVDIDQERKVASQYRISGVPTFVALSPDGKELARTSGSMSLQDFAQFLASAEAQSPAAPTVSAR